MENTLFLRRRKMIDILVTLIPLICMAVYFYRMRAVVMLAFAILISVIADYIGNLFLGRKKWEKYDLSFLVTPVIFTLMLPATAPYWMIVLGIVLAVFVAKIPFGGYGRNIFNPAAFAAAFLAISWPEQMLKYPDVFAKIGLESQSNVLTNYAASYYLQNGGAPKISLTDAMLGNFPGPMGATCILIICACALYLLVRRTISWQLPLGTFLVVILSALLFPRVSNGWIASIVYELMSGVLVFGVFFMASDPVTTPKTGGGRLLFGLLLGLITMLFRHFGQAQLSFLFALLLMNALTEFCEVIGVRLFGRPVRKNTVQEKEGAAE